MSARRRPLPEAPIVSSVHVELPQSEEAERSVLGAILVDNSKLHELAGLLRPEDFYRPVHQKIFSSMVEMIDAGLPVDLLTLADRHASDGALDAAGGSSYLSRLMDGIPRMVNVRHYAAIVAERSIRRQLVRTASEMATEAQLGESDVTAVLDRAERRLYELTTRRSAQGFATMKELLGQSLDAIEKRQAAGTAIHGVPTGFAEFDELTSGLQPGDLIIIAARPSMGKTAWALSAAQNAAIRYAKTVAVFSLEMSAVQLAMRVLCSEGRVDAQKMRRGQLGDHHWAKLVAAYGRLSSAPIFIDETSGITLSEMRAKARRLQAERGLDMIIVDYLQLMGTSSRSENRQQEISSISRGLKEMARELSVPVVALSQLSRAPDQRQGDHRPMLSDLRESGSLEQDADVVAFIFREEVYRIREGKEAGDKKGIAEIIIAKQRNGPTDTVKLAFIREWTRFENLQRGEGDPDVATRPRLVEDGSDDDDGPDVPAPF